jgi:hypothetical protein
MNVGLMGSDKGIQVFALIGLFATALAGWTSSEASAAPAIDQTIPGATNWGVLQRRTGDALEPRWPEHDIGN